jgi:DNA-binding winged helix-turn-helix (wHTH) protein
MSASVKSTFSFREFELDPLERRLLRAGESIALTPKVLVAPVLSASYAS